MHLGQARLRKAADTLQCTEENGRTCTESERSNPTLAQSKDDIHGSFGTEPELVGEEKKAASEPSKDRKKRQSLELLLAWLDKTFAADEEALAMELKSNIISYSLLWLHFRPGMCVDFEDPVSKQPACARVIPLQPRLIID